MYTRPAPVFDAFGVTSELEKALRPKVWLKSGGYLVINQTEALVAIPLYVLLGEVLFRTGGIRLDDAAQRGVRVRKDLVECAAGRGRGGRRVRHGGTRSRETSRKFTGCDAPRHCPKVPPRILSLLPREKVARSAG